MLRYILKSIQLSKPDRNLLSLSTVTLLPYCHVLSEVIPSAPFEQHAHKPSCPMDICSRMPTWAPVVAFEFNGLPLFLASNQTNISSWFWFPGTSIHLTHWSRERERSAAAIAVEQRPRWERRKEHIPLFADQPADESALWSLKYIRECRAPSVWEGNAIQWFQSPPQSSSRLFHQQTRLPPHWGSRILPSCLEKRIAPWTSGCA